MAGLLLKRAAQMIESFSDFIERDDIASKRKVYDLFLMRSLTPPRLD
jgi:hypothetical protein